MTSRRTPMGHLKPATDHQHKVTDHPPKVTDHLIKVTDHLTRAMDHQLKANRVKVTERQHKPSQPKITDHQLNLLKVMQHQREEGMAHLETVVLAEAEEVAAGEESEKERIRFRRERQFGLKAGPSSHLPRRPAAAEVATCQLAKSGDVLAKVSKTEV